MQTIVLTGPESSGKTTLARELAEHFGTAWVPEFARGYLEKLDRPYSEADLLEIARGQVAAERAFAELADRKGGQNQKLLVLDTSLEVIKIWSEVRYGRCHPWILEKLRERKHDLYLLCRPDLAWEPDPLRENPDDREVLFQRYRNELMQRNVTFVEVEGQGESRLQAAIQAVSRFRKLKTTDQ